MNELSSLKFKLLFEDGSRQELLVDTESARVGSGSHCEVRLSAEDAAPEQLEVFIESGGVFARARNLARPVLVNGSPFIEGRLVSNPILRIGRVDLTVELASSDLAMGRSGRHESKSNRGVLALGAGGFPLGFYVLFTMRPGEPALPKPVPPPALWAATAAERCPHAERDAAAAFGAEELQRAESGRERAPFSGKDGIAAVGAFERAAACLDTAQEAGLAGSAKLAADKLRKSIDKEFHVHRVRLERALATKSYDQARIEVRVLLSYVGGRGGRYAQWLATLDRQIELKFAGKKKK